MGTKRAELRSIDGDRARSATGVRRRRKIGRHRRGFDTLARHVRGRLGDDPVVEAELVTLRGVSDELDRLESDPDHSAQNYAVIARVLDDLRRRIVERLPDNGPRDPLDVLDDDLDLIFSGRR